ncbi:MAG: HEAT repeat domain-containing protein [Bradymonadia bacterium]
MCAPFGCGKAPEGSTTQAEQSAKAPDAAPRKAQVFLKSVRVVDGTPADRRPVSLPLPPLEGGLKGAFEAAGFDPGEHTAVSGPIWKVRAGAQVVYGFTSGEGLLTEAAPDSTAKVVWTLEVKFEETETYDNQFVVIEHTAEGPAGPDPKATLEALSKKALGEVSATLGGYKAVLTLPRAEVEGRLDDPSPSIRMAAVDRLAALGEKDAVPALVKRVKVETDKTIKLRIVGAFEELRDPRAEDVLIDLADPRDREMLHVAVLALAVLKTPRANDFLEILASHDAPDVRALVAEARRQLGEGNTAP